MPRRKAKPLACQTAAEIRDELLPPCGRLPHDADARKASPMATGLLDYFPDALAAVAHLSKVGNDQHNPGQPLHWSRGKSADHADCIVRHLVDRGTVDSDDVRHSAKLAWRALALLQEEIEAAFGLPLSRASSDNPALLAWLAARASKAK